MSPGEQLPSLDRRRFLKRGILGGALLFVAGVVPLTLRSTLMGRPPRAPLKLLSRQEHAILSAVAARIAPGEGAPEKWPSAEALDCAGRIDALMAACHPDVGTDFKRLLRLFESATLGLALAGSPRPFTRATPSEQDARLDAWRRSRVPLFRSGFQALKRLSAATYFSSPQAYELVGYPGPPTVPQIPA